MDNISQTLTSIEVAEMIGREHNELLKTIRRYVSHMKKIAERTNALGEENAEGENSHGSIAEYFTESTYEDANGQKRPCFDVTKKGCEFIAHKMNGIKGTEFTMLYIDRFHEMEETINTPQLPDNPMEMLKIHYAALEQVDKKVDAMDGKVGQLESRITDLEDTMTLDHGQEYYLEKTVNKTVISVLGGKESNAYKQIGRKVFAECNGDLKAYFNVNARGNVPRKRYEEAVRYAENWKPCMNTQMLIDQHNAQQRLDV